MREVNVAEVTETVAKLCMKACYELPEDVLNALRLGSEKEVSPIGKEILVNLVENAEVASAEQTPYCHDTGFTVVFMEIGQDVHLVGGDLSEAINQGVRKGYQEGYLRKSVVTDPLLRVNSDDNTPAGIHTEIVPGEEVKITVVPKGGGSENMSAMCFLLPGEGIEGVIKFVLETVEKAGGRACPPLIVGVGIGGSFDSVTTLAKKAILREIGSYHKEEHIAKLEREISEEINKTGIGPQGLGGIITSNWVSIETFGTHITALPVAVNLQCHAARRATAVI